MRNTTKLGELASKAEELIKNMKSDYSIEEIRTVAALMVFIQTQRQKTN